MMTASVFLSDPVNQFPPVSAMRWVISGVSEGIDGITLRFSSRLHHDGVGILHTNRVLPTIKKDSEEKKGQHKSTNQRKDNKN